MILDVDQVHRHRAHAELFLMSVCVRVCVQQKLPDAAASIVTLSASSETAALIKMVQEQQKAIAALSMQLARGTGGSAASAGSVTDDGAAREPRLRNTKRPRPARPPSVAEDEADHDSESERSDADLPVGDSMSFNVSQERAVDKREIVMPSEPERPEQKQKVTAAASVPPAPVAAAVDGHKRPRLTAAEGALNKVNPAQISKEFDSAAPAAVKSTGYNSAVEGFDESEERQVSTSHSGDGHGPASAAVSACGASELNVKPSDKSNSESMAGSESDAEADIAVDSPGEENLLMETTAPDAAAAEKQRVDAQTEQCKAATALFEEGRGFHRPDTRRGQHQNFARAIECYTQAAALNHAEACLELGELYLYGSEWWNNHHDHDAESDRTIQPTSRRAQSKKAVEWYLKACENGVRTAQQRLGKLYLEGHPGIKVDLVEASHWLTKAAQQGCGYSWSLLSKVNLKGLDGIKAAEDKELLLDKAFTCCRQAVEMNQPGARDGMVDIFVDACAYPDLRCHMLDDLPWLQDLIDNRYRWRRSR